MEEIYSLQQKEVVRILPRLQEIPGNILKFLFSCGTIFLNLQVQIAFK